jgi:hypothetical protein
MMDTLCDPEFIELLKLRALTSDKFLFSKKKEIVQVNIAKEYNEFIKEVLLASSKLVANPGAAYQRWPSS